LNNQWVGYDDLKSVTAKVIQRSFRLPIIKILFLVFFSIEVLYAKTLNLGGTMIWSLDQDDYTGLFCRQGPFPLTRRVHDILFSSDKYNEQNLISSTKATKIRTTQKITFVPIHQHTSQRPTSTQSASKSKNIGTGFTNSSTLCLLIFVLFIDMTLLSPFVS
jgi:hypothetical protein